MWLPSPACSLSPLSLSSDSGCKRALWGTFAFLALWVLLLGTTDSGELSLQILDDPSWLLSCVLPALPFLTAHSCAESPLGSSHMGETDI